MLDFIKKYISPAQKRKIKSKINSFKRAYVTKYMSYSIDEFQKKLQSMGIKKGDTVMVHSGWSPLNGSQGSIQDIIKTFKIVIGDEGNLLMVSMPYSGAASEYLENLKCFNVKKALSRMGMMSEIFRRQDGVFRSLHPAHPILAWGKDAKWFVQGHEECLCSCGEGSPLEKMLTKGGKVIFFDVDFTTFTFIHYIEHVFQKKLPYPLYEDRIFNIEVIKSNGDSINVKSKVFSKNAIRSRRPLTLKNELKDRKLLKIMKIGNTKIGVVDVNNALKCTREMMDEGKVFFEN